MLIYNGKDSLKFNLSFRSSFVFNLVVFWEVEGKRDDVLHGVARGKDELANMDGWPHSC